jgi:uncharacterized protein (DUF433 family)
MKGPRGAYPADRAAALSGVPISTVHYWARQEKTGDDGQEVPASTMPGVKAVLEQLSVMDLALWSEDHGPRVRVDLSGKILVTGGPHPEDASGQAVLAGSGELDVLEPFPTKQGKGPHLVHPRPMLRIVPGKLGGSPHLVHTRLESKAVGALATRGMDTAKIYKLYPRFSKAAIRQAIDLEAQLDRNLYPVAA